MYTRLIKEPSLTKILKYTKIYLKHFQGTESKFNLDVDLPRQ